MPMIAIRYVTPNFRQQLQLEIAQRITRLSAEILGKNPQVTAVLVEPASPDSWIIAGEKPTEAGLSAFWLDIKITNGTNTKDQTTAFVREAYSTMQELLGQLHEESYVHVHATDGDAYGYGGRTQNGRWAAASPG
ncbi:MAG: tautomerase family protein [Pseudorhizobium sp.]